MHCYLVVGNPTATTLADQELLDRLETLDFDVTLRDDSASAPSGADLAVLSASCASNLPGGAYKNYAGPIVSFATNAHDSLDWCDAIGTYTGTQIDVVNTTHPISVDAGLTTGLTTVYSASGTLFWNDSLGTGAVVIAERPSSANKTIYTYDEGADDENGNPVAARRVMLPFYFTTNIPPVNATGFAIFDAAVAWAAETEAPPGTNPPTVDAGADANHQVSTQFNRTATEDNGGATITARAWTIQAGPAGVGTTIGTAAALAWTPTVVGTYTLRYTATNSAGSGSDDVNVFVYSPTAAEPPAPVVDRVALVEAPIITVTGTVETLDIQGNPTGYIPVDAVTVRHDSNADIHRSVELVTPERLDWGLTRIRPWITVTGGGYTDTVPLGVFVLTEPAPDTGDPPTYQVSGFDQLYLLDQRLTAPVSYPKGQPILFIVRSLLANHGMSLDRIDNSRGEDTLSEARSWALEFDGSYLDVINDLLSMIGYESLWMTSEGFPSSSPKVTADERQVSWRYDAQSTTTIMHSENRSLTENYTDAPNQWQFWRADVERDDAPVIGDGLYVVNNETQGPSSQVARGGLVVRSSNDGPIEASSQDDLVKNGDAIVADEIEGVTTYSWQTTINPYHEHKDTLEIIDRDVGIAGRFTHVSWELNITDLSMTHEANAIVGGVVDI